MLLVVMGHALVYSLDCVEDLAFRNEPQSLTLFEETAQDRNTSTLRDVTRKQTVASRDVSSLQVFGAELFLEERFEVVATDGVAKKFVNGKLPTPSATRSHLFPATTPSVLNQHLHN